MKLNLWRMSENIPTSWSQRRSWNSCFNHHFIHKLHEIVEKLPECVNLWTLVLIGMTFYGQTNKNILEIQVKNRKSHLSIPKQWLWLYQALDPLCCVTVKYAIHWKKTTFKTIILGLWLLHLSKAHIQCWKRKDVLTSPGYSPIVNLWRWQKFCLDVFSLIDRLMG